jgi:hypothetical protein
MQQMGKTINPLTSKLERSLEQARFSIDTLAMLREKTRGNLSEDLERLLDSTLLQLRMNYVEEVAADERSAREGSGAGESAQPAAGGQPGSETGAGEQRHAERKDAESSGAAEAAAATAGKEDGSDTSRPSAPADKGSAEGPGKPRSSRDRKKRKE